MCLSVCEGAKTRSVGRPPQALQQDSQQKHRWDLYAARRQHWALAKIKEKPEDKLQAVGTADLSQAKATGRTNDKVLQTRELEDVLLEDPDPTHHEATKFQDNSPRMFICSDTILERSQEGAWKTEK